MIDNFTLVNTSAILVNPQYKEVVISTHAIEPWQIVFAVVCYTILIYFWIIVNKEKEKYEKWANPKGRVVNLYKIVKNLMIWYPIIVVICAVLQIVLFCKANGVSLPFGL